MSDRSLRGSNLGSRSMESDSGVTLVPGTDNVPGLSLHGELEVYERAGIPAPAVLQIATIIPARVMKDDKDYGSIAPGKIAERPTIAISEGFGGGDGDVASLSMAWSRASCAEFASR
mgnify:CR=1 FL=1